MHRVKRKASVLYNFLLQPKQKTNYVNIRCSKLCGNNNSRVWCVHWQVNGHPLISIIQIIQLSFITYHIQYIISMQSYLECHWFRYAHSFHDLYVHALQFTPTCVNVREKLKNKMLRN